MQMFQTVGRRRGVKPCRGESADRAWVQLLPGCDLGGLQSGPRAWASGHRWFLSSFPRFQFSPSIIIYGRDQLLLCVSQIPSS